MVYYTINAKINIMKSYNIITLPGDGIGPEITSSAVEILNEISRHSGIEFN